MRRSACLLWTVPKRNRPTRKRTAPTVKLIVNGEERDVAEGLTVARLLEMMEVSKTGTAVARNDRVVRRDEQGGTAIEEGDRIEIIRAVAGG